MTPILQLDQARFRKLAALLGLLIFGLFVTVQVLHVHPPSQADDSHCSVCLAAHGPATVSAPTSLPVPVLLRAELVPVRPQLWHSTVDCALFIRPPPAIV